MPARLAGKYLSQGRGLSLIRALIEIKRHLPLRLEHVSWGMNGQCDIQTVQVRVAKSTLVNVPSHQDRAFTSRRWTMENAGTSRFAVAGFEIGSGDLPSSIRRLIHVYWSVSLTDSPCCLNDD